jgi:L-alanine-DL-glutamate epimerase-like enolase superfamily enzyme
VTSDDGVEGYGEAALDPSAPESESTRIEAHIRNLARHVLLATADLDAAMEPYVHGDDAMRAANAAIETALADAGTRWAGVSLASMFSGLPQEAGRISAALLVNATIAQQRLEAAAAAALAARASGFACVKLKVGMESSVEAEVERVRTVREVIGDDVKLRLDANGAWDEATAIKLIGKLESLDIELVEQPVPGDDLAALGRVRSAVTARIAADEAVFDFTSAQRALDHADILVLKPIRLGGPTVARYVAQYANAAGLDTFVTTTMDTGIGTAMALQVAGSLPGATLAHGLATLGLLEDDLILEPGLPVERGQMRLPDGPGLGVTLDEEALRRYSDGWREVGA